MRNVTRTRKPICLARYGAGWKKSFLKANKSHDKAKIRRARLKYNHPQVRDALNTMYRNLCCYCENPVGAVRADEIEHREPVTVFPKKTFEWDNLHLACSGCNGAKSNKWTAAHPVLDAVADVPISRHLGYEASETGVRQVPLTRRGRTTVEHTDLNREKLRQSRGQVMIRIVGLIQDIRLRHIVDRDDPVAANAIARLEEMYSEQYGSMIRWAVETLL